MQENDLGLHVILNDEVIDLRFKDDKDPGQRPSNKSNKEYGSEPMLQRRRRRIPIPKELQKNTHRDIEIQFKETLFSEKRSKLDVTSSDGLKRSADDPANRPISHSSNTISTPTSINPGILRYKTTTEKNKLAQIIGGPSEDPRFRRERSPASRTHALVTQSESRVSPTSSERRRSKSQSESKFLTHYPSLRNNKRISNPIETIGDYKDDSVRSTRSARFYPFKRLVASEEQRPSKKDERTTIENGKEKTQIADEEPTVITDTSTLVDPGTSLYQASILMNSEEQTTETEACEGPVQTLKLFDRNDPKPCWDDPRLLDKYGKILKPVSISPRKSLSSWTLPLQSSSHCNQIGRGDCVQCERSLVPQRNSDKRLLKRACSKCTCTFGQEDSAVTDCSIKTIHEGWTKEKIFCLSEACKGTEGNGSQLVFSFSVRSSYLIATFFGIGAVCGLFVVAFGVWFLANDLVWTYVNKAHVPKFSGLTSWIAYWCGGVIYGITCVCRTVGYLFILPRNEVYETVTKMADSEPWYTSLQSWT